VTPEEAKKLAALGYISAAGEERSTIDPKDRIGDLARLKAIAALRDGGDVDGAIAAMDQVLSSNPGWSDVRDELGFALAARGEHERALAVFERGIAVTPKLAGPFSLNAATELIELGRFDEAEKHARFAAEAGVAEAHLALGDIALARGDFAGASEEARVASQSGVLAAHAYFLEARVAAARRDFPAAVALLSKTQHEQERTGGSLPRRFHYVAGDVLARLGRFREARLAFEAEIARDPKDLEAYTHLASVQRLTGDAGGAEATLRRGQEQQQRRGD
jgi:tetratricopeptide (TPR) repeat protein